jgi:hypothetical protein
MKIVKIIPVEKRQNYRCHFCGTTRSVKYVTEIFDPVISDKPTGVCCCNKCLVLHADENNCEYHLEIPTVGLCCNAYYKSKRNDGKEWMHFPFCNKENCPLEHPELLEGATLRKE